MGKLYMEKQLLQLVLFLNVGFSFITCQTSTSLPDTGENVTSLSISPTLASSLYSDVLSDSLVQTTLPVLQTSYDTYVPGTESSFQVSTGENSISQFNSNEVNSTNLETKISSTLNNDLSSQSVYVSSVDSNTVSSSMTSSLPLVQTTISVASVPLVSALSVTSSTFILDSINPSSSNLPPSSGSVDPSITLSVSISSLLEPEISGTSMEEASTISESIFPTTQFQVTQSTISATPAFSSLTMMMSDMSSKSSFSTENITIPTESFVIPTNITSIYPTSSLLLSTYVLDSMSSSTSSILFSNESSSDFASSLIDMISVFSSQSESSSMQSDISSPIYSSDSIFSDIGSSSAMILESSVTQSIYHSSLISSDDLLTSSESSVSFSNSDDFSSMSVSEYSDDMQSLTSTSLFVASSSVMDESDSDSFTATDSLVEGTTISPELETTSSLIDISFTTTSSDVVNVPSSMQSSFKPSTDSETVIVPSSMQSFLMSSSSTEIVIEPSSTQSFPISSSSVIVEGPQKHNNGGLTSGEKAAIGICIPIVIIVCLAGLIYYLYRRKYHVASWKLSDVVSYRPWSYSNASYYDDEVW